jgi:hypothetical protein
MRSHLGIHPRYFLVIASIAALASSAGCNAPKHEAQWTPKPPVQWSDITTRPVAGLSNEYRILTTQPTMGLFPANMAVTRVSLEADEKQGVTPQPKLYADPRNEFLQWNTTFDDQMAVSEAFPIDQRDLGGGEADPVQILAAFRALHARIGMIYAVNELSETESEMFGALFDNASAEPVAVIHAQAVSVEPPKDEEKKGEPKDLWETDSRALVRAKFAKLTHACVRELIRKDQPAVIEAPTGWTPAGPVRPVEWPPRHPGPGH